MEEHKAILLLKQGDPQGLEVLVRKYQVQAFRAANLIVRNQSLAEDVVQSCFIKAYQSIHQFDAGRSFGPWFIKSVVNDAIKAANKAQKFIPIQTNQEMDASPYLRDANPGPEEVLETAQTVEDLQEALTQLPPEQRAVIVMRYFLEWGESDMADFLERPPGTIKWRLHKARETLRGILIRKSGE